MYQPHVISTAPSPIHRVPLLEGLTAISLNEENRRQVLSVLKGTGNTIAFSSMAAILPSGAEVLVSFDRPVKGTVLSRVLHDQYDIDFDIPDDLFGLCSVFQEREERGKALLIMRAKLSWLFPLHEVEFVTLRVSR